MFSTGAIKIIYGRGVQPFYHLGPKKGLVIFVAGRNHHSRKGTHKYSSIIFSWGEGGAGHMIIAGRMRSVGRRLPTPDLWFSPMIDGNCLDHFKIQHRNLSWSRSLFFFLFQIIAIFSLYGGSVGHDSGLVCKMKNVPVILHSLD